MVLVSRLRGHPWPAKPCRASAPDDPRDAALLQSQRCVLSGRAFSEKLAQLCSTCDRGRCFKCGAAFPDKVARLCSSCSKNKCIKCGRGFPHKAAKLCSRCGN